MKNGGVESEKNGSRGMVDEEGRRRREKRKTETEIGGPREKIFDGSGRGSRDGVSGDGSGGGSEG